MNRVRKQRVKPAKEEVRVGRSPTGRAVFANRRYHEHDVVGEIVGQLIHDADYGSEYCFELDAGLRLEPIAPFRFINHSCDPNCEFDCFDLKGENNASASSRLLLFATRSIQANDQLTIDYNWSAEAAIPCRCRAANCRGWIVAPSDLWKMDGNLAPLRQSSLRLAKPQ